MTLTELRDKVAAGSKDLWQPVTKGMGPCASQDCDEVAMWTLAPSPGAPWSDYCPGCRNKIDALISQERTDV